MSLATLVILFLLVAIAGASEAAGGTFGGGDGSEASPYIIEDVWDLQAMNNGLNANYSLANDIDAAITKDWNWNGTLFAGFYPIGNLTSQFNGSLDGQAYTITGLFINRPPEDYVGLFGYLNNTSSVTNLGLENGNITGNDNVGILAGRVEGSITKCYTTGSVTGSSYLGGFAGYLWHGTITDSYSTGSASGPGSINGGFVGYNLLGSITNSYSTGDASGYYHVGGFVGRSTGTVTNSYSTGSASGNYAGGFVGTNEGLINNSHATGNANGGNKVGGFAGRNLDSGTILDSWATGNANGGEYIGGFTGLISGTISNSFAMGNAAGSYEKIGGFGGENFGTVTNSYAHGDATGVYKVGGFLGYNNAQVTNVYSTGKPTGSDYVGGLIGQNTIGTINGCYWDTQTSGTPLGIMAGGTTGYYGRTTAEMKQQNTFTGWDFFNVWTIQENTTYPFFWTTTPTISTPQFLKMETTNEDAYYSIEFHATVAPGVNILPNVTWELSNNVESWLTLSSTTGILSGTPTNEQVGIYWTRIWVTDSYGRTASYDYLLTVVNRDPVITATSDITIATAGSQYINDYDSTDDGDGIITWSLKTNASWLSHSSTTGQLIGTPSNADNGTYWVNLTVDDGNGGTDSRNFTLEVKVDTDQDGVPDASDLDDDGDGALDAQDDFPMDPWMISDFDNDGLDDRFDPDDDDDGWSDLIELESGTNPLDNSSMPADADGDWVANFMDPDFLATTTYVNDTIYSNNTVYVNDTLYSNNTAYVNDTIYSNNTVYVNGTVYSNNTLYSNNTAYVNSTVNVTIGVSDTDSDGDGWSDAIEIASNSDPLDNASMPADGDGDGTADSMDRDFYAPPAEDDGLPVWAWMLVLFGVLGYAALIIVVLMDDAGKGPLKKRKQKGPKVETQGPAYLETSITYPESETPFPKTEPLDSEPAGWNKEFS